MPTPHQVSSQEANRLSLCYLNRPDFSLQMKPFWYRSFQSSYLLICLFRPTNSEPVHILSLNRQLNITNSIIRSDQLFPLVQVGENVTKQLLMADHQRNSFFNLFQVLIPVRSY